MGARGCSTGPDPSPVVGIRDTAGCPDRASDGFTVTSHREARIASRIHHHNAVSVVDFGTHEGLQFAVMDYVDGCSLAQLCARNRDAPPSCWCPS